MNIQNYINNAKTYFGIRLLHVFAKRKDQIVFENFGGKGYGDSLKYIHTALLKRNPDRKMIWVVNRALKRDVLNEFPGDIELVQQYSFQHLLAMAQSKIWITNFRMPYYCRKGKDQLYINTWHSVLPWKKVESDVMRRAGNENYIRRIQLDNRNTDIMVSSCRFKSELIRSSYHFEGRILETIIPRCDILLQNNPIIRDRICDKINISKSAKAALYAPTFRAAKKEDISAYDVDYRKLKRALQSKFGGEWVILVRFHPSMMDLSNDIQNEDVINVSYYADAQELLYISDVLITDYSSIMFDYMLTRRPVFLYANDVKEYSAERGVYFSLTDLPFPFSESNAKLEESIMQFDQDSYDRELDSYINQIGLYIHQKPSSEIIAQIAEQFIKTQKILDLSETVSTRKHNQT